MKYIKIFIAAILALTLTACSDTSTAEVSDLSDITESSTVLTTTAEKTTTTIAELTTVSETSETASETSVTTEVETIKNENGLTVSPSGYVLDPNVSLGGENGWDFPEKQPCFIGEPVEGVRFYGINGGEELSYTYDQPTLGECEYDQYIIIEHDGIADEFAGLWADRFGEATSLYSADFDGDGETEIASVRYSIGGMFCCVMELVLYKPNGWHYERFMFNTQDFNDKYISVDIDSENKVLTVSANGFDKSFAYDFSESVPTDTECSVNMIEVNDFIFDGGEITYIVTPLIGNGNGLPETPVDICFKLKFSNGGFTCTDVEFIEEQF